MDNSVAEARPAGESNSRQWPGIAFVVVATLIFSFQDAISKILVADYPVPFILAARYWAFLAAGLALVSRAPGGFRTNIRSHRPVVQCLRGALLVAQLLLIGEALKSLGLAEMTALYQSYPLFGTLLAALILSESVGWRRCIAVFVGFIGILVIVRPQAGVFSAGAFYALGAAVVSAFYITLTRLVGQYDKPETSLFYMAIVGFVSMMAVLPMFWVSMTPQHILWLALLCLTSVSGHFLMIKALVISSVTLVQPFTYLQLVWSVVVGFIVFQVMPDGFTLLGALIVVSSGLFVFYREQVRAALPAKAVLQVEEE